jgi:hypothetical protein
LPPPVTMATLPSKRMVMGAPAQICRMRMAKRGPEGKGHAVACACAR